MTLLKNVNYLDTVSEKEPKFDENEDLIERKTKIRTKLNKHNENRDKMCI